MKLHAYQQRAISHLQASPRSALWLEPGLGKTRVVLEALIPDHLPALVCAPKRVVEHVWPVERDKWRPDLSLCVVRGTSAQREQALNVAADLTIIGRDVLADAVGVRPWKTLVLDESSGFKDASTKRWKAARALAKRVEHVWELTGTPAPNGLLDTWAQVALLDGGQRLGKNLTGFRERFFRPTVFLPGGVRTGWELRLTPSTRCSVTSRWR